MGSSVSFGIYFAIAGAVFLDYYKVPDIAKSVPRGVIFGVVGVALPLTMFNGADQLKTLLSDAGTLGLGLIAAALIAKMLTFGVSLGSGFVGGPLFPSLFIGGTAGVLVHQVIPACRSDWRSPACSPPSRGALVAAPFAMVLMAAFLTPRRGSLSALRWVRLPAH